MDTFEEFPGGGNLGEEAQASRPTTPSESRNADQPLTDSDSTVGPLLVLLKDGTSFRATGLLGGGQLFVLVDRLFDSRTGKALTLPGENYEVFFADEQGEERVAFQREIAAVVDLEAEAQIEWGNPLMGGHPRSPGDKK